MNKLTKEEIKQLIAQIANNIRMSPQNMEDLIVYGQIMIRYTFDIKTGQLVSERI